ncbi:MAG: Mut7-C RNAse domain-containing protein [Desulfomonilaceae bacterium]|nr:Mut7-C RNAse domain-containing protein [Desulfomonilaceae bacterium]
MEVRPVDGTDDLSGTTPAFCVDGMLGRLAKWLRILGYDAEFPCSDPSPERIFITMRKSGVRPPASVRRVPPGHVWKPGGILLSADIRLTSHETLHQLRQIFDEAGIRPDPCRFLSRCVVCNVTVRCVTIDRVIDRIPKGVLEITEEFTECPRCGRVYWEGTHPIRIRTRLKEAGLDLE